MHVELRFPEESVWHWKIKMNFFVFALSKSFIISWGFCSRVVGCWEELKYGTAKNQLTKNCTSNQLCADCPTPKIKCVCSLGHKWNKHVESHSNMSLSYWLSSSTWCFLLGCKICPVENWAKYVWKQQLPPCLKIRGWGSCKYQSSLFQSVYIWRMATRELQCYSQGGRSCLLLSPWVRFIVKYMRDLSLPSTWYRDLKHVLHIPGFLFLYVSL